MTSSNGNIFRVTGPLCGEFTGHRWIILTKASDAELWCFLSAVPEQTVDLRCYGAQYDVTVMGWWFSLALRQEIFGNTFMKSFCETNVQMTFLKKSRILTHDLLRTINLLMEACYYSYNDYRQAIFQWNPGFFINQRPFKLQKTTITSS